MIFEICTYLLLSAFITAGLMMVYYMFFYSQVLFLTLFNVSFKKRYQLDKYFENQSIFLTCIVFACFIQWFFNDIKDSPIFIKTVIIVCLTGFMVGSLLSKKRKPK